MKKLMMALAFVGLGTVAANAQCDEFATPATNKYSVATNSFWANWYVQAGIDMNLGSMVASSRRTGTMVVLMVSTSLLVSGSLLASVLV